MIMTTIPHGNQVKIYPNKYFFPVKFAQLKKTPEHGIILSKKQFYKCCTKMGLITVGCFILMAYEKKFNLAFHCSGLDMLRQKSGCVKMDSLSLNFLKLHWTVTFISDWMFPGLHVVDSGVIRLQGSCCRPCT
jgi:hypothetical protein